MVIDIPEPTIFRGMVKTKADLPKTGGHIGDVYYVEDEDQCRIFTGMSSNTSCPTCVWGIFNNPLSDIGKPYDDDPTVDMMYNINALSNFSSKYWIAGMRKIRQYIRTRHDLKHDTYPRIQRIFDEFKTAYTQYIKMDDIDIFNRWCIQMFQQVEREIEVFEELRNSVSLTEEIAFGEQS